MKTFRTYQLAVAFYRNAKTVPLPAHLKDQLVRAAASAVLNLSEGYGRISFNDQRKFFRIAFGSIRECQAIVDIETEAFTVDHKDLLDHLAASAYKLTRH